MIVDNNINPISNIFDFGTNMELGFSILKYKANTQPKPYHAHRYFQINYISSGMAKHHINNTVCDVFKGDILIIPPMVKHLILTSENSDAEIFEFEFLPHFINPNFSLFYLDENCKDFEYLRPFLLDNELIKPKLNLLCSTQIEVEKILNEAIKELNEKESGYELLVRSLLLKLLILVGREYTTKNSNQKSAELYSSKKACIINAISYIDENYSFQLRHDEVAKMFFISPSYFDYLFKYFTSKTFGEYLTSVRISKAIELLIKTDKKVIEIAMDVGYGNINHFNRVFKKYMHITPSQYRNRSQ